MGSVSRLDAFSVYLFPTWLSSRAIGMTTGAPEVSPSRSSRTRDRSLKYPTPATDRDRTVSRRSEPSSRTALIGEQPNPWNLLQLQDAMSRHRGAKPPRRCGLLGEISLLSPGYLLSVERWQSHFHTTGSLSPTFVPARDVPLTVRLPYAFALDARFPTALR